MGSILHRIERLSLVGRLGRTMLPGLLAIWAVSMSPVSTHAEDAQEPSSGSRRLALVIGQADYRGARLITGTGDAARLAETLTSAGFVTDGGADLEQHLIREKIRLLVESASQSDGVETILVYVCGRVAQINGENVLLPVGAPIERASDVVLNGFRLNDLINTLKLVPAKARIIVVDAGAPPESLTSDRNFSPGLAVIDAPEGFLIVFNQNPGRPLIEPQPPMGLFLKGFLDALQQPVASYADTFALARQRVFEESHNQQMPWDVDKLKDQALTFFPPPPGVTLPSIARKDGERVQLASMSREDAFKKVIASDNIVDYQAFLVQFPKDEAAPTIQYNLAVRREAEVWSRVLRENTADGYWTYVTTYPDGGNVEVARQKLSSLGVSPAAPANFAPVAFADLPPPLPGIEMVASSASMPVAFMPRPPSLHLAPIAAVVAVAAAAPISAALGKQLPRMSGPISRPAWAAPSTFVRGSPSGSSFGPIPARPVGPVSSGGSLRSAGSPSPGFQPIGRPSQPSGVGRAPDISAMPANQIQPSPSFRPIGQPMAPGSGRIPPSPPNQGTTVGVQGSQRPPISTTGNPGSAIRPVSPLGGAPAGYGSATISPRGPIVAAPQPAPVRAPIAVPQQVSPGQYQRSVTAPRMPMQQIQRVAPAPVQRRNSCSVQGGKTICR